MIKFFTFFILTFSFNAVFAQSTWVQKENYPDPVGNPGKNRACAFSIPSIGKGYFVGGYNSGNYSNDVVEYDTATNSWTQEADFPLGATAGVAFNIGDTGYVGLTVGGGYSWTQAFYKYDYVTNTWIQIPNFPGQARSYAVAFVIGSKAYVGSGLAGTYPSIPFNDFYSYNQVTNKWDTIASYPGNGSQGVFGFSIGAMGYIGSGGISQLIPLKMANDFYEFDPSSGAKGAWAQKKNIPFSGRAECSVFTICGKAYVGNGYDSIYTPFADFYEYDAASDRWKRMADFGGGPHSSAPAFSIGQFGYAGTGTTNSTNASADFWAFHINYQSGFSASQTSICAGNSVTFTDTSNFSPTSWQWSFQGGTPDTSSAQNPVIKYNGTGTFDVSLIASNSCGSGTQTLSQYITVASGGILTVTAIPDTICSGQSSTLTVVSGSGAYMWSPTIGLSDSTSASTSANPLVTTTYVVTSPGSGCTSLGQVILFVGDNTVGGAATAVRDTICEGTSGNLSLTGNSSNIVQWQYSPDSINFSDALNDTLVNYKTAPLAQTTWYRALVGKGNCSATSTKLELYVPPALTASFYSTQTGTAQLTFNSDSSLGNIRSYHWDFGDGQTSTEQNPQHTYSKDSTYYVCLTLYDGSNCSYTFCRYTSVTDAVPTIMASGNWVIEPNPFSEELIVSPARAGLAVGDSRVLRIEMYDVLGRVVINEDLGSTTNTSIQLDVSSLAKGMYFVMIRTADTDYLQKVVKQ